MQSNYPFVSIITVLVAASIQACAHTVPKELAAARSAYQQSSRGQTAERAPAELHKAEAALHTAEQAFDDEPEGQVTKDLAYVALRKVQLADVAATRKAQAEVKAHAEELLKQAQAAKQTETSGALAQAQANLSSAEARNKDMADRLSQLASVQEDERGTVATLSGSLLFPSNKATLSSAAKSRLSELSAALMTDPERAIRIEGYTDSRGSEGSNMALSQRRADAVRSYLVSHGHESARVQAEGRGEAEPIASNDDAEGRATNRRVEIVIAPAL